jgi:hypothetical protein
VKNTEKAQRLACAKLGKNRGNKHRDHLANAQVEGDISRGE